jgi:hypothetical protein
MRKIFISLAAAGTALAFATPASAQYYPQPQPYGYGNNGYGNNGYGHGNYGQVRSLQARIDGVQYQIKQLDRRNVIRDDPADRLRSEARQIENRLHRAARSGGLNPYEANDINGRISRLEQRVQYAAGSRYGRYGNNNGNNGYDRDRDGRDDRYEDDHGRDHDNR